MKETKPIMLPIGIMILTFLLVGTNQFVIASPQLPPYVPEIQKATVGSFTIDVSKEWKPFATDEAASLRREFLEQSRQIYQAFAGANDQSKKVDIAAFNLPGGSGSFVFVSYSLPPQSNLIQTLKDQVEEKMKYGIQQGFIRKYLGLVSVDKLPLTGFYTKAIGKNGNFEVSGGLEHRALKNTMIQLTLLAPVGWEEKKTTDELEAIIKSLQLAKN